MNISKIIKRYKYFLIFSFVLILVSIYNNEFGVYAFKNIKSSLIQMLCVLPPVMILLGLMDEWIPREYFMKYMGDGSKVLGILLSFIFAFFAAGPMYAGFPFAAVLLKKGVRESPKRSAFSMTITEAFGTFTPTSITVVATIIWVSPLTKRCISASFSAGFILPCTLLTWQSGNSAQISSYPSSRFLISIFSLSFIKG